MKIAITDIDNLKNPHWGGGQAIATREIGKRLTKMGHSVTVYCSRYPGCQDYQEEGMFYKHIGLGTNWAKFNNLAYLVTLPFTIRNIKADVIIEHFTAPISTCFTPLFTKIPVIGLSSFFAAEQLQKKYKINFSFVERFGAKFYKYFISISKNYEVKMKKLNFHIKSVVIPNGVDEKYFRRKIGEKNYIFYIGRIDIYNKGLDLLIEAFGKTSKIIDDNLYIVGSGNKNDRDELKALIGKYHLDKRIKLFGKVVGVKKDNLFRKAKFTVFPSRFESQGMSALESMALGKPLICFDIPELNWINNRVAIKIKPFSIEDFARKMVILSMDGDKRLALGNRARKEVLKYTWDKTARRYEIFLRKVLRENARITESH